jgi:hypothetical protein
VCRACRAKGRSGAREALLDVAICAAAADPPLSAALLVEVGWLEELPRVLPPELSQAYWMGMRAEGLDFLEAALSSRGCGRLIAMLAEVAFRRSSDVTQTEWVLRLVAGDDPAAAAAFAVSGPGGRAAVERLFAERPSSALRLCLCVPPDAGDGVGLGLGLGLGPVAALVVGGDLAEQPPSALRELLGARPPGWLFAVALARSAADFEALLDTERPADAFALIGCVRAADTRLLAAAVAQFSRGHTTTALQLAELCGWVPAGAAFAEHGHWEAALACLATFGNDTRVRDFAFMCVGKRQLRDAHRAVAWLFRRGRIEWAVDIACRGPDSLPLLRVFLRDAGDASAASAANAVLHLRIAAWLPQGSAETAGALLAAARGGEASPDDVRGAALAFVAREATARERELRPAAGAGDAIGS